MRLVIFGVACAAVLPWVQETAPDKTAEQWIAELRSEDPRAVVEGLARLEHEALPILTQCMEEGDLESAWRALDVYALLSEPTQRQAGSHLRAIARDPKAADERRGLALLGLGVLARETTSVAAILKEESFGLHHLCALLALQTTTDDAANTCRILWKKDATMPAVLAGVTLANLADESRNAKKALVSMLGDKDAYLLYQVAAYGLERADSADAIEKAMTKILEREKKGIRGGLLPNTFVQSGSGCGETLGAMSGLLDDNPDFWASCPRSFADFNGDGHFSGREFYQGYVRHAAEATAKWSEALDAEGFTSFAHFVQETTGLVNGLAALEIILSKLNAQK